MHIHDGAIVIPDNQPHAPAVILIIIDFAYRSYDWRKAAGR